jgi:transketolase
MDKRNIMKNKSNEIRKKTVEFAVNRGGEHIAPSLSCVDILTVLYYKIMNIKDSIQNWENRDRFILSKGHGCYSFYTILNDLGIIPDHEMENFHRGGTLKGCVEMNHNYGIETSCGSLGHGLPVAVGTAFGAKLQNKNYKTYCLAGDGEMQEGSMWEAIQFAAKHKLSNFTLIVDNNGLQAMDFLENILVDKDDKFHMERKLEAFGFEVASCNGHETEDIECAFEKLNNSKSDKPKAIIAHTTKGYGLLCMENIPKFHFRMPTEAELNMGNRYE